MKSTLDQHQNLDVITRTVLEVQTKARSEYKPKLLWGPDELCRSKSIHFSYAIDWKSEYQNENQGPISHLHNIETHSDYCPSLNRQFEQTFWTDSLNRQFEQSVWTDCLKDSLNRQFEQSVLTVSLNRQFEKRIWTVSLKKKKSVWTDRFSIQFEQTKQISWTDILNRQFDKTVWKEVLSWKNKQF